MLESVLKVCWELKKRIAAEKEKLSRLKQLIDAVSVEIDGLPKSNSVKSRVESITAAIIDTENTISRLIEIKAICMVELNNLLADEISNESVRQVLFYRYGRCKKFRDIGIKLGYSERRVYELHFSGLKMLKIVG